MRIDDTFWDKLQNNEKELLVQIALLFPPVSFDIVFHTLSFPPTTALKLLEKFNMLDILGKYSGWFCKYLASAPYSLSWDCVAYYCYVNRLK